MTASRRADVVLVGCEDEENLGLRYIAAYLAADGVSVAIEPFDAASQDRLARRIREASPVLVGLSVIFQRMLPDFARAVEALRQEGIECHLTCGGHFPTLEPEATLAAVPGLDSVVRHEGELTVLELLRSLQSDASLAAVEGLAVRGEAGIERTPSRPLIQDLDTLPFPLRETPRLVVDGHGVASILASRGCHYDCAFCSVQSFYRGAPGPARRTRSPVNVVDEMERMVDELGVRVFIFKDDDLAIRGRRHGEWIAGFAAELERRGLASEVLFRISCRVDEVDRERLARLRDVGLMAVYLGIESGNEAGLRHLNKRYRVEAIRPAADVLDELEIGYEFGFMLFEPWSTLDTISEDLRLLEDLGRRGRSVVDFTKMLPYAGTAVAAQLAADGRLDGDLAAPDYGYLDPRVGELQRFASATLHRRNFEANGLVNRLRMAKFEAAVARRLGDGGSRALESEGRVRDLIRRNNDDTVEVMRLAVRFLRSCGPELDDRQWQALQWFANAYRQAEAGVSAELDRLTFRV